MAIKDKFKVLVVIGTRPEAIKLSRVLVELEKHVELVIAHTGQNYDYELNEIFFEQLGIRKPDFFLNIANDDPISSIANILTSSNEIIKKVQPNAFLIYGDTNSCISALAAKRSRIPIFHMEAGNRCFDLRVPEEINRKIIDHLSDINMVLSEHARRYLIAEGIKPDTIIKTGSSMQEVLDYHKSDIEKSDVLQREGLLKGDYILVSVHREENLDSTNFDSLLESLDGITDKFKKRIIVSTHPRTKKRLESVGYVSKNPMIEFMKPFGFFDYIKLQTNALCVVSDSGTITEEASLLKFPAVTIRQAHERPEGMDEGTIIMSGIKKENILHAMEVAIAHFQDTIIPYETVKDYQAKNVSKKVVKIILSYTEFINRTVWNKNE